MVLLTLMKFADLHWATIKGNTLLIPQIHNISLLNMIWYQNLFDTVRVRNPIQNVEYLILNSPEMPHISLLWAGHWVSLVSFWRERMMQRDTECVFFIHITSYDFILGCIEWGTLYHPALHLLGRSIHQHYDTLLRIVCSVSPSFLTDPQGF